MAVRAEFSKKTKRIAWQRSGGFCENLKCGLKLWPGKFHYDHDDPDAISGNNSLENCVVLCVGCHKEKTHEIDRPKIDRARRVSDKHLGIKKPSTWKRWRQFKKNFVPRAPKQIGE